MRLTSILWFGKKPHGYKYRGKHRVVTDPKPSELKELRQDYERTEQNMLILRHPYLTIEQSYGHMKEVDKNKIFWESVRKPLDEKFASRTVTLAERLIHLKVNEAWD